MAEYKCLLEQIAAAAGVASSLYQGRRTLHSLFDMRVDDKDSPQDG